MSDPEDKVVAAAADVIETREGFLAALLKYGIDTWEKVEQCGVDPDDEEFRRYWEMRVGR